MLVSFDPVAISIFGWDIHWYGLTYVMAFLSAFLLARLQTKRQYTDWNYAQIDDLLFYGGMGVILGGRIGYVLFYAFPDFLADPLMLFKVWQGGMSFHGGLVGPVIAGWWYCRKHDLPFMHLMDRFFTVAPLGLMFGRLGNFFNGELWGRVVESPAAVPWAMVFPHAGPEPRHPSQLYEMLLEGVVLFLILWSLRKKEWPAGARVAIFLIGYALARIICEGYRQPDAHLGFLFGPVTMGMLLSAAMPVVGIIWLMMLFRKRN